MTKKKYEDEIIERYVYQVKKHLPSQAKEIEEEVRGLINDMLEETCQGETPTKEEVDEVLIKLGNPAILADNYRGKARYLIGPDLFPTYLTLLKIVLPTVFFAMSIVTMIELLTEAGQAWYAYLGSWLAGVWNGLIGAFAYVTVIFAIFELKDVNTKGLQTDWSVSSLPPLPKTDAVISRGESIFSIVFYVILTTLLVAAPRLFGAFFWVDGEMTSYPVFDLEVLKTVLPLFPISIGFGILKHVYGLIERSYNLRYAIVSTVCSLAELIISIIIFAGYPIWNQAFPRAFGDVAVIQDVWNVVTSNFVILLILIHLVELITVMYKTFKSKI